MYLILFLPIGRTKEIALIVAVLSFDIKQILRKRRNNDIRISIKNSLLHVSGLQEQKGTVKTMMKWSH